MTKMVSVIIVNWNGEKYIKKCIESLLNVKYENLEIIVIDNDSKDNSIKIIEENFSDKVTLIRNENVGYAGGANKGIDLAKGDYVLIANPDIVFTEEYICKLVDILEESPENAASTGKLLKYDFDKDEIINVIDSTGIRLDHSRHGNDIGQNEEDKGQYDKDCRVFGVSGAAALFKKQALEKIKYKDEYFDNDFFAYKEDIDLSWRLNLYGYKCFYVHDAIAYHGRAMNSSKDILNTIKNRRNQSELLKGISFRNHYLMIIKNETKYSFNKDKIKIYIDILKYFTFFILFDWKCLKYTKEIKNKKNVILEKRKVVLDNIKLSDEEIYKLFDL